MRAAHARICYGQCSLRNWTGLNVAGSKVWWHVCKNKHMTRTCMRQTVESVSHKVTDMDMDVYAICVPNWPLFTTQFKVHCSCFNGRASSGIYRLARSIHVSLAIVDCWNHAGCKQSSNGSCSATTILNSSVEQLLGRSSFPFGSVLQCCAIPAVVVQRDYG